MVLPEVGSLFEFSLDAEERIFYAASVGVRFGGRLTRPRAIKAEAASVSATRIYS